MAHRLQTLFLTLLLILGLTVFPVFAEEDDGSWDGWNDNGWYDDLPEEETEPDEVSISGRSARLVGGTDKDVMALYDARVIDGFKDGTFQPESTVTTGQALKMILLAAGYGEPAARRLTLGAPVLSIRRLTRAFWSAARSPIWM